MKNQSYFEFFLNFFKLKIITEKIVDFV